jgi:ubiquinone/menaquinone biosynthesis C-methylase UbiE
MSKKEMAIHYDRVHTKFKHEEFRHSVESYVLLPDLFFQCLDQVNCCLHLGSGLGWKVLAPVMPRKYIALDLSTLAIETFNRDQASGDGIVSDMEKLPFRSNSVEMILTRAAMEHTFNPDVVLEEMHRICAKNGIIWLSASWSVPPISVLKGLYDDKLIAKIRNSRMMKGLRRIPTRIWKELIYSQTQATVSLKYKNLQPYYNLPMADSDATATIDQHSAIWFFKSRGYELLTYKNFRTRIVCGGAIPIVARKL